MSRSLDQLEQLERELESAATARPHAPARHAAALERTVQACATDPDADEWFDVTELYLELAETYEELGRTDDALAAADAAVAAGLRMTPDARCLRAEILMRAGRVAEAEPIWAEVRAATPKDVWLYSNAGIEYADAGRHETALDWLTEGLRLTLRIGDPEHLVDQFIDERRRCLDRLGLPADKLQDQATLFRHSRERTSPPPTAASSPTGPVGLMTVAWLPAEDYEQGLQLWPTFAASDLIATPEGPLPHAAYCRAMQHKLVSFAEAGKPRFTVVPIRIAPLTAWCTERGHDPESADARAEYVADLARAGGSELIEWPPGRNDPCWCGSGRKYKKCCAAP